MTETKKMTKKDYFGVLLDVVKGNDMEVELTDFINHEIELLNKKKTGMTKAQKENLEIADKVAEVLADLGTAITVTDLFKVEAIGEAGVKSTQHLSALLKKLVDANKIYKAYDKKRAYFSATEIEFSTDVAEDAE